MESNDASLQIRLLGELQLVRHGQIVALPASKKTRALLGYLIATGQPHRRERLCDLLWDGPDDPRAELRWSVSKLRPLLNAGNTTRLITDRERIGFQPRGATIDLVTVRSMVGSTVQTAPATTLQDAAECLRGEFLDGLDLPVCYRFQEWCMAERETANRLQRAILTELVGRLEQEPEEALPYARALVAADPLAETGHATIVRLLTRLGRKREALLHYEHAQRLLEAELGVLPTAELEAAYRSLPPLPAGPSPPPTLPAPAMPGPPGRAPRRTPAATCVGRHGERGLVDRLVSAATRGETTDVVLVTGEPGIGKSHLLAHLRERLSAAGGIAVGARAFEAEAARPYGIWIDLLRAMTRELDPAPELRELGLLLPEFGAPAGDPGDRSRLFDAVVDVLRRSAAEHAMAITLDDMQWCDKASAALLHYVCRQFQAPSSLLVAGAALVGEVADNTATSGVLRSLAGDGRLQTIALAPLTAEETAALAHTVDPTVDAERIFAQSGGNPLFALELARAHDRDETGSSRSVELVIAGQLGRLRERTRDLLVWAAAWERSLTLDGLARVAGFDSSELLLALDELERHGIVRPVGEDAYEFVHDLTRLATYRSISQPRRTLIHRHIARALMGASEEDAALAGDAAHHAALGGDDALAARACVVAGERALRLFANVEASGFAQRGLRHVVRLPHGPACVESTIALLKIRVQAATGPGMRPLPPLAHEVSSAVVAAEAFGLYDSAATGHYLLSVLYQEAGDQPRAEASTLRAAQVGRKSDEATQIHQLANTARCLLELETQISRARLLVDEAETNAGARGIELCELSWARGLLQRWDGEEGAAMRSLERTLTLAVCREDRWREYKCLTWLAVIAFERGRFAETLERCGALMDVAKRLGDDHTPFAMTLQALAGSWLAGRIAGETIAAALWHLRAVDDKFYLAYALNAAAELTLHLGDPSAAADQAREALALASVMGRHNEVAVARALLARTGDTESAQELQRLKHEHLDWDRRSARTRAKLGDETVRVLPTIGPTVGNLL